MAGKFEQDDATRGEGQEDGGTSNIEHPTFNIE